MGQSKPIALVVEDDETQREFAATLLEECDMEVIPCASAEAAASVLEAHVAIPCFLFTDVALPGVLTGADLAHLVRDRFPHARLVVTSNDQFPPPLPDGAKFLPKPWAPLDLLREATAVSP
jgi:two-component system cell cycle response regulator CpdR